MSSEEDFDKIIRQKADEADFPFDESNWEKAGRMIDADRKSSIFRSIKNFYLPGIVVLALSATGIVVAGLTKVPVEKPETFLTKANSTDFNVEPHKPENLNHRISENKVAKMVAVAQKQSAFQTNERIETRNIKEQTNNAVKTKNHSIKEDEFENKQKTQNIHQTPTEASQNTQTPEITTKGFFENNNEITIEAGNLQLGEVKQVNNLSSDTDNSDVELTAKHNDWMPSLSTILPNSTSMRDIENSINLLAYHNEDYYAVSLFNKLYLNIEAGTSLISGWNSHKGTDGFGLNWYAGCNYGFYTTKRLQFESGIQIYNISNIKQAYYSSSNKQYHFGSTASNTLVTTEQLLFAALPFKAFYKITNNAYFGFGLNLGYLIGAKNNFEVSPPADVHTNAANMYTTKGIYAGQNPYNFLVTSSYRINLTNRLKLQAEVFYGLSDLFLNNKYASYSEKTTGLRLGMLFNLAGK